MEFGIAFLSSSTIRRNWDSVKQFAAQKTADVPNLSKDEKH